jgi:glycosyltransferase involved in cell wall biosynthesis
LNVLFICNSRYWGGGEKYVVDVALGLSRRGHVCRIAANDGSPLFEQAATHNELDVIAFDLGPKLANRSALDLAMRWPTYKLRLRRFLDVCRNRFPIDVVHLQYKKEQLVGTPVADRSGLPVVWTEHGPLPPTFISTRVPVALYRRVSRVPRRILCVAHFVAHSLEENGVRPDRLAVCHNGIEPFPSTALRTSARRTLGIESDSLVVGTTGRVMWKKGLHFLLDAISSLQQRIPRLRVVIIGDGPARTELASQARGLGIDGRVTFTGHLQEVRPLLPALDVFALPSLSEGLPFSVLEAMDAGLPVVAARVGGVPELVADGETGLLVPPADTGALTSALLSLLEDPARRVHMGEAARRRIDAQFTVERMIDGTEKAMLAAINERMLSTRSPAAAN